MPSKKTARSESASNKIAYQLKITLQRSKPPIWRRLRVPADCNLEILHDAIQIAMGWENSHLHQYVLNDQYYAGLAPFGDPSSLENALDARQYCLSDLLKNEKSKLIYEYDFGDSWTHQITLEEILPPSALADLPEQPFFCLAGKGACPPEDSGGTWGYYEKLNVLQHPKNPDYKDIKEWMGDFDPEAFDLDAVNRSLKRLVKEI